MKNNKEKKHNARQESKKKAIKCDKRQRVTTKITQVTQRYRPQETKNLLITTQDNKLQYNTTQHKK